MSSQSSGLLSGRVAVVTGGSRGIGRALAAALRAAGAQVVISGRSQEKLDRAAAEIGVVPVQADAMSRDEAVKPVAEAIARFGGLDILVNNVGGSAGGNPNLFANADDRFEANLILNLTSAYWTTKAAVASMRDRGHGRIIQIGSGASKHAAASPAYTAAKHGLVGLTKQLAVDLARHQITVNCVCPGWTATDLVSFDQLGAAQGVDAATARKQAEAESAQRRILEPELLGPMVVLLASDAGGPITGQVISVDGGYRL
ncbi:SDR family oxidoreductase [Myxococcota bacterium]|nr:SDR family oxidoreductase [Myxococcota bacterium]